MHEYKFLIENLHTPALHNALAAVLGGNFIGISTYGTDRPFSAWLAGPDDETAAIVVITAHDPVSLSVDKSTITADGRDTATITVQTFRPDAEPVTLLVNDTPVPITLTNGIGTLEITSDDPTTITIVVQNPENRTTDILTVEAL
jgi:hypothetical protein